VSGGGPERGFYNRTQFVHAAQYQRQQMQAMLDHARAQKARHLAARAPLEAEAREASRELGVSLLPKLDDAHVARAVALTGYTPLQQEQWTARMQAEATQLRARLTQIQADPRFRDRELLRHPRTGSLTRQIQELSEHRRPWAEVIEACAHPRMDRLVDVGYGTPSYAVPFWRMTYYQDWEAGDAILEKMPGREDFAAVREEYLRARETVGTLDEEIRRAQAEWEAGASLEREADSIAHALQTLVPRYTEDARDRLVRHLHASDRAMLEPRIAQDPNVKLLFLKAAGLTTKLEYLDALAQEKVFKVELDMVNAIGKLDADVAKLNRPKKYNTLFPAEKFERRFRDPRERYTKHWDRYDRTYGSIYAFDTWQSARIANDFLWWDLMTDARYDGSFIPSVSTFHQRYPHYQYARPDDALLDDESQAAAAAAAVDRRRQQGVRNPDDELDAS
jgi:hypothetical protein